MDAAIPCHVYRAWRRIPGQGWLDQGPCVSSWSAVPDAIASICSYEAERKMIAGTSVSHSELYDKIKPLLRFAVASNDNRLTGMPVIAWLLPSPTVPHQD